MQKLFSLQEQLVRDSKERDEIDALNAPIYVEIKRYDQLILPPAICSMLGTVALGATALILQDHYLLLGTEMLLVIICALRIRDLNRRIEALHAKLRKQRDAPVTPRLILELISNAGGIARLPDWSLELAPSGDSILVSSRIHRNSQNKPEHFCIFLDPHHHISSVDIHRYGFFRHDELGKDQLEACRKIRDALLGNQPKPTNLEIALPHPLILMGFFL